MSNYRLVGVDYLELYLSDDLPTIKELSRRLKKYPSGIVKSIKIVISKYSDIELTKGLKLEDLSRKELLNVLEMAKEGERWKMPQNIDKVRKLSPVDFSRIVTYLKDKTEKEIQEWLLEEADIKFWMNYNNKWKR